MLNDCLTTNVGGLEDESSADVVDPAWVNMVASVDESTASALTADWLAHVGEESGETLGVTPEAIRAVTELLQLCKLAVRERLDVVHTWSL